MLKTASDTYDAVIIGAGIGGLICGCYLAKAGMKVLIAEQHYKPGGYCTSFKRKGLTFDAAAHSFGGYKHGLLGKIFEELGVNSKLSIRKIDPSDIVATPDYSVSFYADVEQTVACFQSAFPAEADNIKRFFDFIVSPDPMFFVRIRRWTFKNLLDEYFSNDKLKTILSFPLFGNGGLPPSLMSAFIGAKIFQEFLLDGGYHPEGGMQALPNALAERFRDFGGDLRLSSPVITIRVSNNEVQGVVLKKEEFIPSRLVVSSSDARRTFSSLIGGKFLEPDFMDSLTNMVASLSTFIVYLGIDKTMKKLPHPGSNLWYLSHYDLHKTYLATQKGNFRDMGRYLAHVSPDQTTVLAFINAPFKTKKYWEENRNRLADSLVNEVETHSIPDLSKYIFYKETATPHTLHRYTLNYKGSAYGWESTPAQLANPEFRKSSCIRGLYLAGHWTTYGLGVPGVTYVSYDTAKMILRQKHKVKQKAVNS